MELIVLDGVVPSLPSWLVVFLSIAFIQSSLDVFPDCFLGIENSFVIDCDSILYSC